MGDQQKIETIMGIQDVRKTPFSEEAAIADCFWGSSARLARWTGLL
jgi:hypothetical protein